MEGHLMLLSHDARDGRWLGGQVFYVVVEEGYLHMFSGANRQALQVSVALTKRHVDVRQVQTSTLFQLDVFNAVGGSQSFVFLASNAQSMERWMRYLRQWQRFYFADPVAVDALPEDAQTLHLLVKHAHLADTVAFQRRRIW
ncbi:hypothetical protein DYB32_010218 [Aphanomyces invadans]|uniref:PH domain-containing protein n=1 Tax=Aphanomyces invadans TaxID=157072 RepID=A0A418AGL8_9STRA|nr:hypothetical protein DYB32_010218 [Aphanomyces invadans]